MRRRHALLALPLLLALPAAAQQRIRRGDTTIVRHTGPGVWGKVAAVEVKRIGGESEATTFGSIAAITALKDGSVVLHDRKGPNGSVLRQFDRDGTLLRTIGRQGAGPGEYGDLLWIRGAPDGTLLLRDPRNSRVVVYRADGTIRTTFTVRPGFYSGDMIRGDAQGGIRLRDLVARPQPNVPTRIGFVRYDAAGTLRDTLQPPAMPPLPESSSPWSPGHFWTLLPDGRPVTFTSDRYLLRIHQADGTILGIAREVAATPFDPEERAQNRRQLEAAYRATKRTEPVPDVPTLKPFAKDLDADLDGRIWVQRRTASERVAPRTIPVGDGNPPVTLSFREPVVYDAFRADGAWLGEVTFPRGAEVYAFSGDRAWGTVITDDEVYLVQWRLPGAR